MPNNNSVYVTDVRYFSLFKGKYGENTLAEIISILSKYSVNIIGENIVLSGCNVATVINGKSVDFTIEPGWIIQDEMLLNHRSTTTLHVDDISHFNKSGLLVINLRFNTYITKREFTYDESQIRINHISPTGNAYYSWDHERDSIILAIYNFDYDDQGNIIHLQKSAMNVLNIEGKEYTVGGYNIKNFHISRYIDEYLKLKGYEPGGGSGSIGEGNVTSYTHTQSILNSQWIIEHNQGKHPFLVKTFNMNNIEIEGFIDYQHQTDNSISIFFSQPIIGIAQLFFNY